MVISAFVKLCKVCQLVPHGVNIEALHLQVKKIISPPTEEDYNYIDEKRMIFKVYTEDQNPDSAINPVDNEPGLLFHEFIFLLALIALNSDQLTEMPDKAE
jgi:hypothetical protein